MNQCRARSRCGENVCGLKKEFGAEVIGVAVWERMRKKFVENGKIVGE